MSSRRARSGPCTSCLPWPVDRASALSCQVISRSSSSKPCQRTRYSRVCPLARRPVFRTSTIE
eukprot:5212753-Prymnesium_polylepis.1